MLPRALTLRLASPVAIVLLLGASALACKAKGNGVGTAPEGIPCPTTRPVPATPCPDEKHVGIEATVCNYDGTCSDPTAAGQAFYFCPGGTLAAWKCIDGSDAGPIDAGDSGDGGDAGDASDAPDAEATTDADAGDTDLDAADADDASDAGETTTDADDASDTGDALDAD